MTRKRRFLISAGIGVACALVGGLFLFFYFPKNVNEGNFHLVQEGMPERDVENLLGGVAQEYAEMGILGPAPLGEFFTAYWYGDHATISIVFADGIVLSKHVGPKGRSLALDTTYWSRWRKFGRCLGVVQ